MGVTKQYLVQLDKEGHQEIYDRVQKLVIVLDTEEKADRFTMLINKFEDNKLSIGLIDIKIGKLGICNKKYELEKKKETISASNGRIINAIERLLN